MGASIMLLDMIVLLAVAALFLTMTGVVLAVKS
jgi:hypothetical protein